MIRTIDELQGIRAGHTQIHTHTYHIFITGKLIPRDLRRLFIAGNVFEVDPVVLQAARVIVIRVIVVVLLAGLWLRRRAAAAAIIAG